jgi:hypothetical protein
MFQKRSGKIDAGKLLQAYDDVPGRGSLQCVQACVRDGPSLARSLQTEPCSPGFMHESSISTSISSSSFLFSVNRPNSGQNSSWERQWSDLLRIERMLMCPAEAATWARDPSGVRAVSAPGCLFDTSSMKTLCVYAEPLVSASPIISVSVRIQVPGTR